MTLPLAVSGAVVALVVAVLSLRRLNFHKVDFPRRVVEIEQRSAEARVAEVILRKKMTLLNRKERIAREAHAVENTRHVPLLLERPAEMDQIDEELRFLDQQWERELADAAAAAEERIAANDRLRQAARRADTCLLAASLLVLVVLGAGIAGTLLG